MSDLEPLFSWARKEPDESDVELLPPLSVVGLFAGIGGIERGLQLAGHHAELLCEYEESARTVLAERFPGVEQVGDVRDMQTLPDVDLVAAGFPCKDLSQAGRTKGIDGEQSGLIGEVFRLLRSTDSPPKWLLLENVPFMLRLQGGRAMHVLVQWLEELGYSWAYRILDTRAFGLPHRRRRVLLLASQTEDPKKILYYPKGVEEDLPQEGRAYGFYWTEGKRGLGWAVSSVPPLKGGSGLGIPSQPAIWFPESNEIIKPEIRDAERLQGFPADWTKPAVQGGRGARGARWSMVGNAVSVPVARWLGDRLRRPMPYDASFDRVMNEDDSWPTAAWGDGGQIREAFVTEWPLAEPYQRIEDFLRYPGEPLSERATAGFLKRAREGNLNFKDGFLDAVDQHLGHMEAAAE